MYSTKGIRFRRGLKHCRNRMPVVDYLTEVELWCITSNKCAIVEKNCPDYNQMRRWWSHLKCAEIKWKGVDVECKMVYMMNNIFTTRTTMGVFRVSSDEWFYTQSILFCVRWGIRIGPIRRQGDHFVRHLHILRQFRANVIWIVTFWLQCHISIFIAIIKLKNILPLVRGLVRRFRIAPVSKCTSP